MKNYPIQHYIDKLQVLKEYMAVSIDGGGEVFLINLDALPRPSLTPDEVIKLFFSTGLIIARSENYIPPRILTFEEYYQSVVLAQSKTNT